MSRLLANVSCAGLTAVFSGLGVWQVKRMNEKEDLISRIALQRQQQKTIDLDIDNVLTTHKELDYFRVKISGKFDHSREIHIVPRQMLDPYEGTQTRHTRGSLHTGADEIQSKTQSATDEDRNYGGYIITPFQCQDKNGKLTDKTIMVNRGFLPDNQLDKNKRDINSLSEETTTVTGIFRIKGDKANPTSHYVYNSDESARFNNKHHETMAKFLVEKSTSYDEIVYPFCVDELVDSPSKHNYDYEGTPVGGQTRMDIPNNHLGYVLQWFGLAIAVVYFWRKKLGSAEQLRKLREGGLK